MWRGNPQFVLEHAFEEVIKTCKMEIFDSVDEVMKEQDMSHRIIHIHINLPIDDDDEVENDERGGPTCSAYNTQLLDRYGRITIELKKNQNILIPMQGFK